ncbi:MAG: ATP-binding protein [Oscillospiraceae bacterium]|nr:ATP-binding protein [Oscillospiraceae bacterium]
MKKRIYLNFLILILLSALLLSASVGSVVYNAIRGREISGVKDRAVLAADLLNNSTADAFEFADYRNLMPDAARITVIAPDGTVLLDNKAVASSLENHNDRDEFRMALQNGHGEAVRYSSTLGEETYYYAIRLDSGNVIRVSKTMSRISGAFIAVIPAIAGVTLLVLFLANIIARRLTRNIIAPISGIDFDGDNQNVYDELLPYVKKIDRQKSELSQQMALLKNRADTIEAITGNMKEGFVLIDKNGVMLTVNKSAADILGEDNMAGKNILHICRDIGFMEGVKNCLSGTNSEIDFERGGKVFNVLFSHVRDEDIITGAVIFLLDISDKRESEKQRREFSANVSHELKTPLTTISALAEMMENDMVEGGDIKTFAGKISVQSKRLINIIEDIIKLSEFDEGKIIARHTEFDLPELTRSVVDALREKADGKNVSIGIDSGPVSITANRQMIDELLYNLVDNAIKYNKDGGRVTVTLSCADGMCKIAVADTGIGISGEDQSRVFERFYRADKSRSKKTGGTGLGLSIVKHIAEYHGGSVKLVSTQGDGTVVECCIADRKS